MTIGLTKEEVQSLMARGVMGLKPREPGGTRPPANKTGQKRRPAQRGPKTAARSKEQRRELYLRRRAKFDALGLNSRGLPLKNTYKRGRSRTLEDLAHA